MAAALPDHVSAQSAPAADSERLVAMLDLQRVGEGAEAWTVHVIGVHSDGEDFWIQVAPHPDGADSFVLRLSPRSTARHALVALAAAPLPSAHTQQVVSVVQGY